MTIVGILNGGKYMDQNFQNHKEKLRQQIEEQLGKLVYTYETHLKNADFLQQDNKRFKWIQIILSAISASGFIATVITDQAKLAWLGGVISILLLVINGYLKDKDFSAEQKKHRDTANLLWSIREDYYSLLTDLDSLTVGEVMNKRDKLKEKTAKVYATAPQTDARSYKAAQQALKVEEAQCFAAGELNMLLPAHLQHDVVDKENRR